MGFIRAHSFAIFCVLGIIWLIVVIGTQIKFKRRGTLVNAKVVGNKQRSGYFFPVFEFYFEGKTERIDGHMGESNPFEEGSEMSVYYLPGNSKGVMREKDVKIKLWQIVALLACAAYAILDFSGLFHK